MEEIEKINEIKNRVLSNKGIYFGRVPEKEWTWFKKYASEEWCDDYGMAFAAIIKGVAPPEDVAVFEALEELRVAVEDLQIRVLGFEHRNESSSNGKVIKTLSGKVIKDEKVKE